MIGEVYSEAAEHREGIQISISILQRRLDRLWLPVAQRQTENISLEDLARLRHAVKTAVDQTSEPSDNRN